MCDREYDESITYLMCVDLELVVRASSSQSGYPWDGVEEDALQCLIWMNRDVKHLLMELHRFIIGKRLQQDLTLGTLEQIAVGLESRWFNITLVVETRAGSDPFVGPLLWYAGFMTSELF